MHRIMIAAALVVSLAACTDTTRAKLGAYGEEATIKCYSGGQLIYEGRSTGRVQKEESGADGYAFKDAATGKLKEVSGDCNVTYGAD
ncbi:hypothetical protein CPT_Suzuki_030 [Stenotrophomonas phage Suzuki]|nr:hypothetical protein CPT_Suzuki_030 [Stenotrophomonas phage Suzuki]